MKIKTMRNEKKRNRFFSQEIKSLTKGEKVKKKKKKLNLSLIVTLSTGRGQIRSGSDGWMELEKMTRLMLMKNG